MYDSSLPSNGVEGPFGIVIFLSPGQRLQEFNLTRPRVILSIAIIQRTDIKLVIIPEIRGTENTNIIGTHLIQLMSIN